jgi:hypothetical protein
LQILILTVVVGVLVGVILENIVKALKGFVDDER